MDWGFILGLVVIATVLVGLIVLFGRRFSKYIQKEAPESDLAVSITPTGNVLFGGMVGFWGACIIAYKLAPQSAMGAFVSTVDGAITAIGASVVVFAIAMVVLEKLGHPSIKRGGAVAPNKSFKFVPARCASTGHKTAAQFYAA